MVSMPDDSAYEPSGPAPPNMPHGLGSSDGCPICRVPAIEFFASLPRRVVDELQSRTTARDVAAGAVLCAAGEAARALYVLRAGRMKVRAQGCVVKICRAGEILGGGAVAASTPSGVDFVAIDDCHVDVIMLARRRLRTSVSEAVSECAAGAHRQMRAHAVVLSAETIARLARVLAELGCFAGETTDDGVRVPLTLSRRRIGQLLALSEAAVAHILEALETRGVLYADGTGVTILTSGRQRAVAPARR